MPFTIPNLQDAGFRAQAAPDSGDFRVVLDAILGNGVLVGCAVTPQGTPNMTVAVAAGTVVSGGVAAAVAGGNATIDAAEANARFDLVTVTGAGAVVVVKGTAATTPVFPATSDVVLAAVYVPPGTASVDAARLTDKRAMVTGLTGVGMVVPLKLPDGTQAAPSLSFANRPQSGMYLAANVPAFAVVNTRVFSFLQTGVFIDVGTLTIRTLGTYNTGATLAVDADNVLALRNGVNPQGFRVYGTYTDASNYERLRVGFVSDTAYVVSEAAGTGTGRAMKIGTEASAVLYFRTVATDRWYINVSGMLVPSAANTYSIGKNGSNVNRIYLNDGIFKDDATRILSATRQTGWTAPTGTPTRTSFDTASVTLPQLAERLKALIDDLTTHGLIGA